MNKKLIAPALALCLLLCSCALLPAEQTILETPGVVTMPPLPEPEAPTLAPTETAAPLPATTAPETTQAPDPSPLETALADRLAELDGTWSVYVKHLDTGLTVRAGYDGPMIAASLIKLYVAGAYYDRTLLLEEDPGYAGRVDVMLDRSDNEACNALIDYLSYETINGFIHAGDYPDTSLGRKMLEQTDRENYTSPRDCGLVLEQMVQGTYVDPQVSQRLLDDLRHQQRTAKLPAGVPAGTPTANKTGELTGTENDAAVVWSPGGTYIICVMSNGVSNYSAQSAIVELSRMVYDYFNADPGAIEQEGQP